MNRQSTELSDTENLTIIEAVRGALRAELSRSNDVLLLGEDIGKNGGVFRASEGLYEEFGEDRVIDTPLSESGIVGSAIGLAAYGKRPVAELQFMGFIYPAFDQLISHAARLRSRSNGRFTCPLVVRAPYGGGIRAPELHSESTEAFFTHYPGLKVVIPSTPYDTKGMLIAAIRDPDPVLFLEPKQIYRGFRQDVPVDDYTIPLGEAKVRRQGSDISVITWGAMLPATLQAAEELSDEVDVEVIDLRTLKPLDEDTLMKSFRKTGRAAIVHEAPRTGGVGAELTSLLQERSLLYQEAPIARITGYDTPFPDYALEDYYLPGPTRIKHQLRATLDFEPNSSGGQ